MTSKSLKERFEVKYEPVPWTGCWVWTAACSREGSHPQPAFIVNNKRQIASRVAYELYVGPIPEGKIVRHKCDNSLCMNPAHLELGTQLDNMRDRLKRGRWKGGRKKNEDSSSRHRKHNLE